MGEIRNQLENYIRPGGIASWFVGVSWATYEIVWGEGRASVLTFCLIFIVGPAFYRRGDNGNGSAHGVPGGGGSDLPAVGPGVDGDDPLLYRAHPPQLGLLT